MAVATKTYSLRLTETALEALQNIALVRGVPAADLGRQAVEEFITRTAADIAEELARENARRQEAVDQVRAYAAGTHGGSD